MTATMEATATKTNRRSRYRETSPNDIPAGDILDDIGAGPQTAQEANAAYNEAVEECEEEEREALEWARTLEITSIKYLNGKVSMEFKHGIENFKAKTSVQSVGDVPSTFTAAINALAPHIADIIFRDKDEKIWQAQRIEVKGVNLKHHEGGNIHAGISFQLNLECNRHINTAIPYMPLYNDSPEVSAYEKAAADAIEKVIAVTQTLLSKAEKTGNLFADQNG